ncbi:ABC transporter substrate-binding protein [Oceanimonas sp. NS1]|nr:ABC transporter substrate-binding protein [Oceanimonas sp. NS1]
MLAERPAADGVRHRRPTTGKESLLYCAEGAPFTFNPQLAAATRTLDATAHQLYDRLLDIDPETLQPVPALALDWHRSDDGLHYRFTLRPGVQFHHTAWFSPSRPLNADDVVFSFQRLIDNTHPFHGVSGGHYPFFDSIGLGGLVKRVRALGPREVEFELRRPDASFIGNLATDYAVVLSAEYAGQLLAAGTPNCSISSRWAPGLLPGPVPAGRLYSLPPSSRLLARRRQAGAAGV